MHSAFYTVAFYTNPLVCEALEGLLLWRLFRSRGLWLYPYLATYVCYDFVRTPTLLLVRHLRPAAFLSTYWTTDVPAQILHFLILWEIARSLFLPHSTLRRVAWNTVLAAEAVVIPIVLLLCWSQLSMVSGPSSSVPSLFEQYSSLAQALLLLLIAGVARYYRIPFGRNMHGMVFSLGPYLLLDSFSFATYQVFGSFRAYLQMLPSTAFTGMIAVWLWAFWEFAPSPLSAVAREPDVFSKHQWNTVWQTTLGAVRRRSN